jgi:hypothetical protein
VGFLCPGVKQPVHKVHHSPPSSATMENEQSCTPTATICCRDSAGTIVLYFAVYTDQCLTVKNNSQVSKQASHYCPLQQSLGCCWNHSITTASMWEPRSKSCALQVGCSNNFQCTKCSIMYSGHNIV